MSRKPNPTTRFYQINPGDTGWARIWITDDGCISVLSDWGNFGYWFGAPASEFRVFLIGCDTEYLLRKFAGGVREFKCDKTVAAIRRAICAKRRAKRMSAEDARDEWNLCSGISNEFELGEWRMNTTLEYDDYCECAAYNPPHDIQMFLQRTWPLFVAMLRDELAYPDPIIGALAKGTVVGPLTIGLHYASLYATLVGDCTITLESGVENFDYIIVLQQDACGNRRATFTNLDFSWTGSAYESTTIRVRRVGKEYRLVTD